MVEAKKNRKATSTRITMELFKENQKKKKLPSLRAASSSVLDNSSFSKSLDSSLVVGNRFYSARGKRGAVQWQVNLLLRQHALRFVLSITKRYISNRDKCVRPLCASWDNWCFAMPPAFASTSIPSHHRRRTHGC
jgi:hypothetical protein